MSDVNVHVYRVGERVRGKCFYGPLTCFLACDKHFCHPI